ncbi:MAG: hypothetical protein IJ600_12560, partial [Lachnospiraceae bacterium]|nr:hypothetical protein [Lachnospiraceae bacterium]
MITADTVSDFLELAEKNGWQIADEKVGRLLSRGFSAAQRMEAAAAEAESFGEQFDRDMMIELQAEIGRQEIFGMLAEIVGMRIAVNNAETEETLQEEELLLPDDIM